MGAVSEPFAATPSTPAFCVPKTVAFPVLVTTPVRFAFVVTVAALPLMERATAEEVATEAKVLAPVA